MEQESETHQSIFEGVSLSNKVFNKQFVRCFGKLIKKLQPPTTLVVIFDTCERVNMKVFGGLSEEEIVQKSQLRAEESRRMFVNILSSEGTAVRLQSEVAQELDGVESVIEKLHHAYSLKGEFYSDVCEQVRINLLKKSEKLEPGFIEKNIDNLGEYIILELAWFYSFFKRAEGKFKEVYPGPELFTKRKLVRGEYEKEAGLPALLFEPLFLNIESLSS